LLKGVYPGLALSRLFLVFVLGPVVGATTNLSPERVLGQGMTSTSQTFTRRLPALLLTLVALALLALPAAASARTNVAIGIGDQQASMFDQSAYRALKFKKARYFIRWDAIRNPAALAAADAFVAGAKSANTRVFLHISTNNFADKKAKLPSVKQYKRDVGKLIKRYKAKGVREWGVWNEANHKSQPTYRSPKRAAQFFVAMRGMCKGCTIVALDVLDQAGVTRYIQRFYAALSKSNRSRAKIVGIHNYSDINRKRTRGTKAILKKVKSYNRRTQFWLTETGGVVNFGSAFKCSESRAASRLTYLFKVTKQLHRDLKRVYVYNWTGDGCRGKEFDAGLTNPDGSLRPGYKIVKTNLGKFTR
jgi:hypothetical protein